MKTSTQHNRVFATQVEFEDCPDCLKPYLTDGEQQELSIRFDTATIDLPANKYGPAECDVERIINRVELNGVELSASMHDEIGTYYGF